MSKSPSQPAPGGAPRSRIVDREIKLDFYSALRTGFGSLSPEDAAGIRELL